MTPEEIAKLQQDLAAAQKTVSDLQAAAAKTEQSAASLQTIVKPHADALRQCAASMLSAGIGADNSSGHASILNKMADHMEAEAVLGRIPSSYSSYLYAGAQPTDLQASIEASVQKATEAFKDSVASLTTKLEDAEKKNKELAASAAQSLEAGKEKQGGRKSLHAGSSALLKRIGLEAAAEAGQLTVSQIDEATKKSGLTASDSIALKLNLKAAGLIAST